MAAQVERNQRGCLGDGGNPANSEKLRTFFKPVRMPSRMEATSGALPRLAFDLDRAKLSAIHSKRLGAMIEFPGERDEDDFKLIACS